jgi:hypothetical protein
MPDEDRYRATPVRVQRGHAEQVSRAQLAAAVGHARDAEVRLDALRADAEAARARLGQAQQVVDGQATAGGRAISERFAARCRRALASALDAIAAAEDALADRTTAIDAARRALARSRAEREVIERHFARWRDARRKLAERRTD